MLAKHRQNVERTLNSPRPWLIAVGMNPVKLAIYCWISRLFMKAQSLLIAFLMLACVCRAQPMYDLDELQGAWWSDTSNPTADFAITNAEVWLDFDACCW